MIYNLPEALWVFAVTLWSYRRKMKVLHWRISLQYIPLIYPIALELFQYWHITDGRFDLLDILASTVGWAMAMLLSNSYSSRSWHHGQGHFILLLYAMVILSDVV